MNVDSQDEKLADLHVNLRPCESDLAGQRDLRGDVFAGFDSVIHQLFEKRCLLHVRCGLVTIGSDLPSRSVPKHAK